MISSWTFFGLVDGEVGGSLRHQPSGSGLSGGVYVLVGGIQLTSPAGGFSICKQFRESSRDLPW